MAAKRALLVGCNYPGTNAELRGCINDVWGTKDMLINYYGFQEEDICIMIDTDKKYTRPTGRNMKAKLTEMVNASQDGDLLVFHFSGHGTQVPSDNNDEADGKDEAICPTDMNVITDDDLRVIFSPLASKPGVKLTFIADCCHSGTLLDHEAVVISGPKAGGPPPPAVDTAAIQNMLASLGAGGKREMKNRSLPAQDLMGLLSEMLGQPVSQGNVRSSLGTLFGGDASVKALDYSQYMQMAAAAMSALAGGGGGKQGEPEPGCGGILAALLGACLGGGQADSNNNSAPGATYAVSAQAAPQPPQAGSKPPAESRLPDDVGILITGCQSHETSADACPSGDPARAHGALSNALHTVVRNHFSQHPEQPLTNRNLVIAVREALAKTGFAQNPCLECSARYADEAFVVPA